MSQREKQRLVREAEREKRQRKIAALVARRGAVKAAKASGSSSAPPAPPPEEAGAEAERSAAQIARAEAEASAAREAQLAKKREQQRLKRQREKEKKESYADRARELKKLRQAAAAEAAAPASAPSATGGDVLKLLYPPAPAPAAAGPEEAAARAREEAPAEAQSKREEELAAKRERYREQKAGEQAARELELAKKREQQRLRREADRERKREAEEAAAAAEAERRRVADVQRAAAREADLAKKREQQRLKREAERERKRVAREKEEQRRLAAKEAKDAAQREREAADLKSQGAAERKREAELAAKREQARATKEKKVAKLAKKREHMRLKREAERALKAAAQQQAPPAEAQAQASGRASRKADNAGKGTPPLAAARKPREARKRAEAAMAEAARATADVGRQAAAAEAAQREQKLAAKVSAERGRGWGVLTVCLTDPGPPNQRARAQEKRERTQARKVQNRAAAAKSREEKQKRRRASEAAQEEEGEEFAIDSEAELLMGLLMGAAQKASGVRPVPATSSVTAAETGATAPPRPFQGQGSTSCDDPIAFHGRRSAVLGTKGMAASTQPLATEAGLRVLRQGGNAVDAAVAMAAALNVTEPCSTGIGGDAFALFFDAKARKVKCVLGNGKSPKGLTLEELERRGFCGADDAEWPPYDATTVSVPGTAAAWVDMVEEWGSGALSLAEVLQPAIELAEDGFLVAPITAHFWQKGVPQVGSPPARTGRPAGGRVGPPPPPPRRLTVRLTDARLARRQLLGGGPHAKDLLVRRPDDSDGPVWGAPRPGEVFRNPNLARTFRTLAGEGKRGFYEGRVARAVEVRPQRGGGCPGGCRPPAPAPRPAASPPAGAGGLPTAHGELRGPPGPCTPRWLGVPRPWTPWRPIPPKTCPSPSRD